jgi:uncharacterized membrane protein YcaP (DUF421 family)
MPPWLNLLLRSLGMFLLTFVLIRLLGKKHPAKLTPLRYVIYSVIAVITALIATAAIELTWGLLALSVWILLPLLFDYLALRSKAVHDLLHGKETILIKKGKIMEENLKQVRMTGEELLKDLRTKNVFNLADVEFAVLETSGDVNVLLKSDKRPLTAKNLEWKVTPQTEPQTVMLDGTILHTPLTELGLTRSWIQVQLENNGVSLHNVFLGQVDSNGELYLDLFDDAVELANPSVREMLYATLQKSQADVSKYALETQHEEAKERFTHHAARLQQLMDRLRPYLLR